MLLVAPRADRVERADVAIVLEEHLVSETQKKAAGNRLKLRVANDLAQHFLTTLLSCTTVCAQKMSLSTH